MAAPEKVLVRASEKKIADSVVGQPKKEAENAIIEFFKRLIAQGDLEQSTKALKELEKKTKWEEDDLKLIKGLRKRVVERQATIDQAVDNIFQMAKGTAADVRQAKLAAAKLLKDHGQDLAFARSADEKKKLKAFVDQAIAVYGEIEHGGTSLDEPVALEYAKVAINARKYEVGGTNRNEFEKRAEQLQSTIERENVVVNMQTVMAGAVGANPRDRARYEREKREKVTLKEIADRGADAIDDKRKAFRAEAERLGVRNNARLNRLDEFFGDGANNPHDAGHWNRIHERVEAITRVNRGNPSGYDVPIDEQKKQLKTIAEWVREARKPIALVKERAILEGVDRNLLGNTPRLKSKIKERGVLLEPLKGNVKDRVIAVVNYVEISGDATVVARGVELIAEALEPGANSATHPAIFSEAARIYGNLKNWDQKHGEFEQAIFNTQRDVERKLLNLHSDAEKMILEQFGIDAKYTMTDAQWDKIHELVAPGMDNAEGKLNLTPKGKQKIEFVRANYSRQEEYIDSTGAVVKRYLDNDLYSEYQRMQRDGLIPTDVRDRMNQRGMMAQLFDREYEELIARKTPPDVAERIVQTKIHERIESLVFQIMRTQDGSREAVNQMSSWELFELFGHRFVNADTRDLWQARLGLYDVSVYAGSAESIEDWSKIASFMPKEFLWMVFDEDAIKNVIQFQVENPATGVKELKSVSLSMKGMLSALEMKVPGTDKSAREIWMGEILGSDDMSKIDRNKRRFFAFALGLQMGVEFEMSGDKFQVKNNPANMERARIGIEQGKEIMILNMVGLDSNGEVVKLDYFKNLTGGDELKASKMLADFEKNDIWGQYGWYVNNALMFNHLTLNSVELERGGNAKGMWRYMPNVLRKLHGAAMKHYFNQKDMGMVHARDMVDSYWRSFIAWKLRKGVFSGNENVRGDIKEAVKRGGAKWARKRREGLLAGVGVGEIEEIGFDQFYYEVAFAEDLKENEGVNGSLRSIEDVRNLASAEGIKTEAYKSIVEKWKNFDPTGTFNWGPLLEVMGVYSHPSVTGETGLRLFLQHYDKYKLMNWKGVQHGDWRDFIKYTGKSNEAFNNFIPITEHPGSDELISKIARHIEGYLGTQGKEAFATKYASWSMRMRRSSWSYETKINREGKEASEKWDVYGRDRDGNIDKNIQDSREIARAKKMGYVIGKDGYVYDKKGEVVYRTAEKAWYSQIGLFKPFGWGSPMIARGMPQESWTEQKKILKQYLRNRTWNPDRYAQENMRFQARLMFGANLEKLPKNALETVKLTAKDLIYHPWKIPLLLYTIPRGILVNLGVDLELVTDFFNPGVKAVQKVWAN